jgi:quinol monooxygenase YgiN
VLADDTSNRVQIATLSTILSSKHTMPYVLIVHEVADYQVWKQIFDAAADLRREAGERSYQVLKYANQPNMVVHFSAWTSLDNARQFFESPQLVQIRAEAGVKSPEFIYLEQLDSGNLGNRG